LPAKVTTALAILDIAACLVKEVVSSAAEVVATTDVLGWVEETLILVRELCQQERKVSNYLAR